ncbi:TPA: sel1 repeat family protein [Vibrio vulnificus]|uniref:Sel1 repeat family protein n=1 Tax=Vibrio vulnificus TaxID=672 RepID=A0A8H9N3G7_VIBVL|nr:sel1 repeat family protein [Vibrio vulnificus]HAS8542165.1 sel1 repeat family protein [Vibrio vulnificus]
MSFDYSKFISPYLESLSSSQKGTSEFKKATSLLAQNVKIRDPEALAAYSILQLEGTIVERKAPEAKKRLTNEALGAKPVFSAFMLGVLSSQGLFDYEIDHVFAEKNLRKVALTENVGDKEKPYVKEAAYLMSQYYLSGEHFEQDKVEAKRFLDIAVMYGEPKSLALMGEILLYGAESVFGDMVEPDIPKAMEYLGISIESGLEGGAEILVKFHLKEAFRLSSKMSDKVFSDMVESKLSHIAWRL